MWHEVNLKKRMTIVREGGFDINTGKYVDFHNHSNKSDGKYSCEQLIELAIEENVGVFAITDHNEVILLEEFLKLEQLFHGRIRLIQGSEVSMIYETSEGEQKEIHVVVLFKDPEKLKFLAERKMDREGYISAIKEALGKCGVWIPDYDELKKIYPETSHLGRKHIADWMCKNGVVDSVDAAFDIYIGGFGERRAFVDSAPFRSGYGTMKETIKELREAGGDSIIAIVLAHPFYYKLDETELRRLISEFKAAAGPLAGMETLYRKYNEEQRAKLMALAQEYGLVPSAGSDYHGQSETDGLDNKFPMEIWIRIEENYKKAFP